MKKIFQVIGLISLTCFSFFMTEKTTTVVNNMDDIMISIKENADKYKNEYIDAVINDDTIIPGVKGKIVNINKSYKNMKINGYYSDKLYVYDYEKPKISLEDNIDKYIIKGNPSKRMISLVFIVGANDNIDSILNIINNYNVKSTFFVDPTFFTNNIELIENMINMGHNIGIYTNNYNDYNFEWLDVIIKKVNKQKYGFCYNINNNIDNLNICKLKNNYTIKPIVISEKTPLVDIKNNLESGNILSLKINSELKKELSTIIIYIKSKGLTITNLEENILE